MAGKRSAPADDSTRLAVSPRAVDMFADRDRLLGADGLHVTAGIKAVKEAIAALKPDLIVGVGGVTSSDDAMRQGELGIDYILFGPLSGSISPEARDMAQWWAQTMEIPSVLSDPRASTQSYDAAGCEFIGLPLALPETVK